MCSGRHQVDSGDACCQQHAPEAGCRGNRGTAEGLVVGVGDDVQSSAVGLLAGRLDLVLWKLEGELPFVPQLKGVGVGDPLHPSPVSGGPRVGVCKPGL